MSSMIERRSSLAAAGAALTPKNFANQKTLASETAIGPLYYSSDLFFPNRPHATRGFYVHAVNLSAAAPTHVGTANRLSVSSFA